MDEREALIAKEAAAAASLRSVDRLVPASLIALVGSLALALFPSDGLVPIAMVGATFCIVTVAVAVTRRAHLAHVRRQLKALEPPPIPPARLIRD